MSEQPELPDTGDVVASATQDEVPTGRVTWLTWVVRVLCVLALLVVVWVLVTAWPVVVHGHPAYAIALGTTVTLALLVGAAAAEQVHLQLLQVQNGQQVVESGGIALACGRLGLLGALAARL